MSHMFGLARCLVRSFARSLPLGLNEVDVVIVAGDDVPEVLRGGGEIDRHPLQPPVRDEGGRLDEHPVQGLGVPDDRGKAGCRRRRRRIAVAVRR